MPEVLNERALSVINRVSKKLTGCGGGGAGQQRQRRGSPRRACALCHAVATLRSPSASAVTVRVVG
jgi:hypothetical protein